MTKNNYTFTTKARHSFIDVWSMFYLIMVYSLTLIFDQTNVIIFAIYFICALPFLQYVDKFASVCFILSTMSYYFVGADEGLWSIYTILAIIVLLRAFKVRKSGLSLIRFLFLLWMILAVLLSYYNSIFNYTKGMFAIIYNVVVAILIATILKINKDTIVNFLPKIASFQLIVYVILLLINGSYDGYGYSISADINHNTFGSSVVILGIIIFIKIMFFEGNTLAYKFAWVASFVLTFVCGSRNALLAMVLTSVIIYIARQRLKGKMLMGVFKFILASSAIVFVGLLVVPVLGVDLSRYDYIELLNSGGSNRVIIWETLSPVIWEDYRWFGYGPSHFCSEQMIKLVMNLKYKHTHNTFFEAWGELGFFGVVPFLLLLIGALKEGYRYIKKENDYLMMGFILIAFLLLSIGESFFANVEIWIIIGILIGSKNATREIEKKEVALQRE